MSDIIVICVIESTCPFICEVNGKFTIEALQTIEDNYCSPDDIEGVDTIMYECFWNKSDYELGGIGDGYFDLNEVERKIL